MAKLSLFCCLFLTGSRDFAFRSSISVVFYNGSDLRTTIFAGDHETITGNGQPRQLYYVGASGGLAAVYVKQTGQTDKIYYPLYFSYLCPYG